MGTMLVQRNRSWMEDDKFNPERCFHEQPRQELPARVPTALVKARHFGYEHGRVSQQLEEQIMASGSSDLESSEKVFDCLLLRSS